MRKIIFWGVIVALLSACGGSKGSTSDNYTLGNNRPTVNAGRDKTANINETITITGMANDSDGTVVAYEWRDGDKLLATTESFEFFPTIAGTHTLVLTVTDDKGLTASDDVVVTVIGDSYTLSTGLFAYFKFDGNTLDSSGNGNHGIEYGQITYTKGVIDKSASFDGINDYIRVVNKNRDNLNKFSISLYLLPKGHGGALFDSYSWNKFQGRGFALTLNSEVASEFMEGTSGEYLWFGTLFDEFSNKHSTIKTRVERDRFIHVCAIYDNGDEKLYINGELKAFQHIEHKFNLGNYDFLIGTYFFNNGINTMASSYNQAFLGQIDELRFYNRVLNETEIEDLYQMSADGLIEESDMDDDVEVNNAFDGVWIGEGKEIGGIEWSIEISIDSYNREYKVDYPSLKCGGDIKLISMTDERVEFRENLTYGLEFCENNGKTVLIKTNTNKANYIWYHENGDRDGWGSVERTKNN